MAASKKCYWLPFNISIQPDLKSIIKTKMPLRFFSTRLYDCYPSPVFKASSRSHQQAISQR